MELLEQCQIWHENDEYQKIIDALEAIPEGERTPEQDLELARAYNNQGDPGTPEGRALFQRAIELMEPHRAVLGEDYSWNFRMGYAHYYLDREEQALGYFQKALTLHPGDDPQYNTEEEIRFFIDDCRRWIAIQSGEGIVLTPEDVEELEGMCEGPSGYFYKMLSYLEETIRAITAAVDIPVVAIGGINAQNLMELQGTGVDGVAVVSALFGAQDIEAAARSLPRIQWAARQALARLGVSAPVQVSLVNMYFGTTRYDGFALPAGRYDAVRVDIGQPGTYGRNWWCVLYPGLCAAACGGYDDPAQTDLVCGDYILRFRAVEWWQQLTASRADRVLVML